MKTLHIVVTGRVQGVFFRASTQRRALDLGISGTAKNLPDGSVEIFAQGDRTKEFLSWCAHGPAFARVENLVVEELGREPINGFKVLR
jgi:acylphosphatase